MHIKSNMVKGFGGFELDMSKIGSTSVDKWEIELPYTGELPEPCDSATLFFRVTPEDVRVVLETKTGKRKPARCAVATSRDEIDAILWPLFWFKTAETKYHTRTDNGLTAYWNGHYQAEYMAWHSIGQQPVRIIDIIKQLSKEQQSSLFRDIDRMRQADTITEQKIRNNPTADS